MSHYKTAKYSPGRKLPAQSNREQWSFHPIVESTISRKSGLCFTNGPDTQRLEGMFRSRDRGAIAEG